MSGLGSGIVFFSKYLFRTILFLSHRRLETKTNKKLADVYQPLLQGGIDRNESEREEKLKETPNDAHVAQTSALHSLPTKEQSSSL
ncbi:hypothetical protein EV424DRAFT_1546059 [Suillus variegatus]|nr:hypothetical protein EV424DRAFT_1546059 [Suillus variegatus]